MKNKINFKIVGSGPTGLLLSIVLSKFDCNIFLTDLLSKDKLINKDKTYAITHSTRKILLKFRLWKKLEPFLFGFDTLSISDSVTSVFTKLKVDDLDDDISSAENIGWVVKHSDVMNVFFREIENYDNIFFMKPQDLSEKKILFDYEFLSTGANSLDKKLFNLIDFKKNYNQACLTFKVSLRGNCEKRAYEIFRDEGPLALLPLEKNLYQIIWTSSTSKSIERLNSDKNFLMDNLSTILPIKFKLDQIIGEFNIFPVSLSLNFQLFNMKKLVFVGDAFHTFHPVGGQGLNSCWRDVNTIFDLFNKNTVITKRYLTLFKFKYYLSRILDIIFIMVITDSLIFIFANRNPLLFPIRKFSFFFLNNFLFIRKLVINQMTKSLIYSRIK
ncbi:MAG: FAD-dependent monooxygenase [Prochlorococcus marinus CUG1438]|nr:FAD-dependent monooxygenase [Prochlorococcus marinus CUG1438]